ncbi:hypothetical protein F511_40644 [Dorcoceras hygrometricum]|uniref:Uncharacterized protein n=1 Tax=Dorcoceras hygrometricum TaxID=472368 RepID=A0A2Z7ARR6_9LAMI|nr:hypothetical protein F511_40644 [Dorcoceras hygrometricum]
MVVDLIGIYVLKGPYCTLTTTNWFFQALSVIPRGSWGDVVKRFTMIRWEWSKDGASKQLEEKERTKQAQLQTKRCADAEVAPDDQLEDENKEAGEEKERALQELMKKTA